MTPLASTMSSPSLSAGQKTVGAADLQRAVRLDLVEQLVRVREELASLLAVDGVVAGSAG